MNTQLEIYQGTIADLDFCTDLLSQDLKGNQLELLRLARKGIRGNLSLDRGPKHLRDLAPEQIMEIRGVSEANISYFNRLLELMCQIGLNGTLTDLD